MRKITRLREELCKSVIEKEEMVEGLLLGLLAGQHVLLVGPPGTAKSMVVHQLGSRLTEGRFFSYLMTRFTRPEEIIGPVSLKALEKDDFRRNLTGRAADAHFVFLDEVFNCGSGCMNTLLTLLNERVYYNGTEKVAAPLIMMVGAVNEIIPETDCEIQAFYDRFLLRYEVQYLQEADKLKQLFGHSGEMAAKTGFTLQEVLEWQEAVKLVEIPPDIVDRVIFIVKSLREKEVSISDRRVKESRRVLQSKAYLEGRNSVSIEDLNVLMNVFWNRPEDKRLFNEICAGAVIALEVQVAELIKEASQILLGFQNSSEAAHRQVLGGEVTLRLTNIEKRLGEIREISGVPYPIINDAVKKVHEIHSYIIRECLSLDAQLV